jgi:hypothetical protein
MSAPASHACPHCGGIFEDAKAHKRSTPQHRRFFAICRAAYFSWPESPPSGFRPANEEHARYWLEMRAGHFTVTTTARIESHDPDKVYALVRAFLRHSEDHRLFIELDGNLLIEKRTKSIDYNSLSSSEFSRLKDAVCEIIEMEIGVAAEKLLSETEKAA